MVYVSLDTSLQNLNTAVSIATYDFGYCSIHEPNSCRIQFCIHCGIKFCILQYTLSHKILYTAVYIVIQDFVYYSIHESDSCGILQYR